MIYRLATGPAHDANVGHVKLPRDSDRLSATRASWMAWRLVDVDYDVAHIFQNDTCPVQTRSYRRTPTFTTSTWQRRTRRSSSRSTMRKIHKPEPTKTAFHGIELFALIVLTIYISTSGTDMVASPLIPRGAAHTHSSSTTCTSTMYALSFDCSF